MPPTPRQVRYVAWLSRNRRAIAIACVLAVGLSAYLATFRLPLEADFSYLLPADAPSVRAAERLAQRMPAQDTMLMLVVAPDPASREAAGARAIEGMQPLMPHLIARLETDDDEARAFVGTHRHLFIALDDLKQARAALDDEVTRATLRANPMFIDLEDRPRDTGRLDELRAKQQAAEARLAKRSNVSADGRTQVIVIRTAFRATEIEKDVQVMAQLEELAGTLRRDHPSVTIGFAGGPAVTLAEHAALTRGMVMSSLITMVLVGIVLFLYLRSIRMLRR
jgi:predicted RND superfamily exporter protein